MFDGFNKVKKWWIMTSVMATRVNVLLAVIFILFKYIPHIDGAVRCYRCLVAPPNYYLNQSKLLCKDFDYSEKFIVNCPYSTFCMKTMSSAKIPVPINGTDRDCASQKLETQQYYDGKWHAEVSIEEPYKEGCFKVNDKGARTSTIEHCYCKGDLCNSSKFYNRPDSLCILFAVIGSLLMMKF